jgi:colanic acid/amylovoran biosynthesis glycosyltransferase
MICAHYLSKYLATTLNWLHTILRSADSYEPIMFARTTSNLQDFPLKKLYALSDLGRIRRLYNLGVYKSFGYFPLFYKAAKDNNIDLLHVHLGYDGYRMLPLKRKLRVPMVTGFFGIDASKYLQWPEWRQKYQRLFDEGECFLALGPRMREALVDAGCPARKLHVFHVAIVVEEFPFRARVLHSRESVTILMGATFREKKGIAYALDALALLKKRSLPFKFVLAGDGPLRPQIEQRISDLDLRQNVELLGYVDPLTFRGLMEQAHIVILPSVTASDGDTEGTPLVLVEALAMGIPVVSTQHADIPEIVKDGVNGFLVPERDSGALAERLIHLVEHPESWEGMGRAGREHVMEHFNAAKQFDKLMGIYSGLIRTRDGAS